MCMCMCTCMFMCMCVCVCMCKCMCMCCLYVYVCMCLGMCMCMCMYKNYVNNKQTWSLMKSPEKRTMGMIGQINSMCTVPARATMTASPISWQMQAVWQLKKKPCVVVPVDDETRFKKITTSTPPMHIIKPQLKKRTTGSFKNTTDIKRKRKRSSSRTTIGCLKQVSGELTWTTPN